MTETLLEQCLNNSRYEFDRYSHLPRNQYYLHVSDIMKAAKAHEFCPRDYVLTTIRENRQYLRQMTPGLEYLFASGNALHDLVRNKYLQLSPDRRTVYGSWSCKCGHTYSTGTLPMNMHCDVCGGPVNVYHELDVIDAQHRIVGHPDLLLMQKNRKLRVVEIKSIDRKDLDFDTELNAPLGDHVLQGTFYYWMLKDAGYNVDPELHILYADRNLKKMFGGRVYKEFVRTASPRSRLEPFYAKAALVRESLIDKTIPDRICDSDDCPRAKNCTNLVSCFSRESDTYVDNRD